MTLTQPNLHFADLQTSDDILKAMTPYMSGIFPELYAPDSDTKSDPSTPSLPTDPILTDRSASLWSQLVAPPPLQPPSLFARVRDETAIIESFGLEPTRREVSYTSLPRIYNALLQGYCGERSRKWRPVA